MGFWNEEWIEVVKKKIVCVWGKIEKYIVIVRLDADKKIGELLWQQKFEGNYSFGCPGLLNFALWSITSNAEY